jgi:hypothetical protein
MTSEFKFNTDRPLDGVGFFYVFNKFNSLQQFKDKTTHCTLPMIANNKAHDGEFLNLL